MLSPGVCAVQPGATFRLLPGFSRHIERGESGGVQILVDGTNSNTAGAHTHTVRAKPDPISRTRTISRACSNTGRCSGWRQWNRRHWKRRRRQRRRRWRRGKR